MKIMHIAPAVTAPSTILNKRVRFEYMPVKPVKNIPKIDT